MHISKDLLHLSWSRVTSGLRHFSKTAPNLKKKDILAHEKLPVCDYGEVDTKRKRLYVFGSCEEGALGVASFVRPKQGSGLRAYAYWSRPVRNAFDGFREVMDVEAGHGFTLLKVRGQKNQNPETVFGAGLNTHSQLGYHSVRAGAPMGMITQPAPIGSIPLVTSKVLAMGCGRAHTVVSFEGGRILSFGDNSSGQCGRIPISDETYFGSRFVYQIPRFGRAFDEDVVSIVSKFDVTFCLTRSGRLFSFGANNQGQLGRGMRLFKTWEPGQVEGDLKDETVTSLATSGNSVLAVTASGHLFGWGCNESGEVNPDDPGRIYYEPKPVPVKPSIGKVIHVSTGEQFAHVVTEKGEVYAWGLGHGLGLGPRTVRITKPTLMPPPLFGQNDLNPDVTVTKVFAGFFHVAAINSRGDVYSWGRNAAGCLGLGLNPKADQFFPLRVALAGFAEKVAIGVDHTVVLCRGGI